MAFPAMELYFTFLVLILNWRMILPGILEFWFTMRQGLSKVLINNTLSYSSMKERISITIDQDMVKDIDKLVDGTKIKNRSSSSQV